ncbi:MAG: ribbon-helix-helix domain-containing protein [Desulfobacteria bacterium]
MPKSKIAISLDEIVVKNIDRLVRQKAYKNRSQAIEEAVREKLTRLDRSRLAREVLKLDPKFEHALAEEGLSQDQMEWPEY